MRQGAHYGYVPPTALIMKRMKMIAMNPAALTAAFVSAPEMDAANVRAANDTARMRRTIAAKGLVIFETTPIVCFHRPPQTG